MWATVAKLKSGVGAEHAARPRGATLRHRAASSGTLPIQHPPALQPTFAAPLPHQGLPPPPAHTRTHTYARTYANTYASAHTLPLYTPHNCMGFYYQLLICMLPCTWCSVGGAQHRTACTYVSSTPTSSTRELSNLTKCSLPAVPAMRQRPVWSKKGWPFAPFCHFVWDYGTSHNRERMPPPLSPHMRLPMTMPLLLHMRLPICHALPPPHCHRPSPPTHTPLRPGLGLGGGAACNLHGMPPGQC